MTPKEQSSFNAIQGYQFEHWTAKLLKNLGFDDTKTTDPSQDYGIDVISKMNYGRAMGIQCKHYNSKTRVGYRAVEEANSGVKYYKLACGIVLTNTSFTPQARQGARKSGIILWNRNDLELLTRLARAHLNIYDLLDYERKIIPLIKILMPRH